MIMIIVFLLILINIDNIISINDYNCDFDNNISKHIRSILCAVENGKWYIPLNSSALNNAGCLLGPLISGGTRCDKILRIPNENELKRSPLPPPAKNKQYQKLAMKAEELVPKTFWREAYADSSLLLTKNDRELPKQQLDSSRMKNKKLKQLLQCATRQPFIRKSFDFSDDMNIDTKCKAMEEPVIISFKELWFKDENKHLGGILKKVEGIDTWIPDDKYNGKLLVSAMEALEYFYMNYGGIWTGCFKMERSSPCRGALSAAAIVSSTHIIYDIAGRRKEFSESSFVAGYMLASLGRALLHGDTAYTSDKPITSWNLKCTDFVALQGAYLKLYIKSFGAAYNKQLDHYIPMAFPPKFEVNAKQEWKHLSNNFEPVYTSIRNWMYTEAGNLIDFGPYRPLVAEAEVRSKVKSRKRVLIDVGANGFFASPKYMLDSYSAYLPFTHAIMVEPEPHFSASVPKAYTQKYNITFLQIYTEVNTDSDTDIIKMLPSLVSKDDFVVLKFDVDPNRYAQGPTMEWGFLFSIMANENVANLVDELYIELHFHMPMLYWSHLHSNWEALDAFRYLRKNGAIVHAWP